MKLRFLFAIISLIWLTACTSATYEERCIENVTYYRNTPTDMWRQTDQSRPERCMSDEEVRDHAAHERNQTP